MLEIYNHLAISSFKLFQTDTGAYIGSFVIVSAIIVFIGSIIYFSFIDEDETFKDGQLKSFIAMFFTSLLLSFGGACIGFLLSIFWSLIVFYLLPLFLFTFGIYKIGDIKEGILNFFKNSSKRKVKKQSNKIVNETIEGIKCEELARQAWESLKVDFPNMKYETVLEHMKNKMN